jgi:hypothetical protein
MTKSPEPCKPLATVNIDRERDRGSYREPNDWMHHTVRTQWAAAAAGRALDPPICTSNHRQAKRRDLAHNKRYSA